MILKLAEGRSKGDAHLRISRAKASGHNRRPVGILYEAENSMTVARHIQEKRLANAAWPPRFDFISLPVDRKRGC